LFCFKGSLIEQTQLPILIYFAFIYVNNSSSRNGHKIVPNGDYRSFLTQSELLSRGTVAVLTIKLVRDGNVDVSSVGLVGTTKLIIGQFQLSIEVLNTYATWTSPMMVSPRQIEMLSFK